jgi:hypothetical protein
MSPLKSFLVFTVERKFESWMFISGEFFEESEKGEEEEEVGH